MLNLRRTSRGLGSGALAEYCEQLRFRRLNHARFLAEQSARRSAQQAGEVKSQFIAMMSHELRTPLNSIIGFSDILVAQGGEIDANDLNDYGRHINESGRHLIEVINSILEMAKLQSGTYEIALEPHDLAAILADSIARHAPAARNKGVSLETEFGPEAAIAAVDPVRFRQCADNLLANAVRFTEAGGKVSIGCARTADEVVVTIADTGIGMDADGLARAMTPFGQAGTGLGRNAEGTGLGLCITRQLAELQRGRFEIDSEPGAGTTVTLGFKAAADASGELSSSADDAGSAE